MKIIKQTNGRIDEVKLTPLEERIYTIHSEILDTGVGQKKAADGLRLIWPEVDSKFFDWLSE